MFGYACPDSFSSDIYREGICYGVFSSDPEYFT